MSVAIATEYSAPAEAKFNSGCRVFVSNLPFQMHWKDLKELARQTVGEVGYVEIFKNYDGRSRGVGIVQFSSPDEANKAVSVLNGYNANGRNIGARIDSKPDRVPRQQDGSPSGPGFSAPRSAGSFTSSSASGENVSSSSGPSSSASPSASSSSESQSTRVVAEPDSSIFISNLPWTCSWRDLKEMSRSYGNVLFADVLSTIVNGRRRSKGLGIVRFQTAEAAQAAIAGLNGTDVNGRQIVVRLDEPRERRQPQQTEQNE